MLDVALNICQTYILLFLWVGLSRFYNHSIKIQ